MTKWILIYWIVSATGSTGNISISAGGLATGNVEFSDQAACKAALDALNKAGTVVGGICTRERMCPAAGEAACAVKINQK